MARSVSILMASIILISGATESSAQLEKRPTCYVLGGITVPLNPETLPDIWKT